MNNIDLDNIFKQYQTITNDYNLSHKLLNNIEYIKMTIKEDRINIEDSKIIYDEIVDMLKLVKKLDLVISDDFDPSYTYILHSLFRLFTEYPNRINIIGGEKLLSKLTIIQSLDYETKRVLLNLIRIGSDVPNYDYIFEYELNRLDASYFNDLINVLRTYSCTEIVDGEHLTEFKPY